MKAEHAEALRDLLTKYDDLSKDSGRLTEVLHHLIAVKENQTVDELAAIVFDIPSRSVMYQSTRDARDAPNSKICKLTNSEQKDFFDSFVYWACSLLETRIDDLASEMSTLDIPRADEIDLEYADDDTIGDEDISEDEAAPPKKKKDWRIGKSVKIKYRGPLQGVLCKVIEVKDSGYMGITSPAGVMIVHVEGQQTITIVAGADQFVTA